MGLGGDIQGALSDEILATAVGDAWRLAEAELLDSVVRVSEEIQRLEALRGPQGWRSRGSGAVARGCQVACVTTGGRPSCIQCMSRSATSCPW